MCLSLARPEISSTYRSSCRFLNACLPDGYGIRTLPLLLELFYLGYFRFVVSLANRRISVSGHCFSVTAYKTAETMVVTILTSLSNQWTTFFAFRNRDLSSLNIPHPFVWIHETLSQKRTVGAKRFLVSTEGYPFSLARTNAHPPMARRDSRQMGN